jgi:hypothetical protein
MKPLMATIDASTAPIEPSTAPIERSMASMDPLITLHERLDGMKTALEEWLDNPPSKGGRPRGAHEADHEPRDGDPEAIREAESCIHPTGARKSPTFSSVTPH